MLVDEDEVAEAMAFLLERTKLVVEGAGAVGVAALLAAVSRARARYDRDRAVGRQRRRRPPRRGDPAPREPVRTPARPAGRGSRTGPARSRGCCHSLGDCGANLLDVQHIREGVEPHIRETGVQLVLETRGPEHALEVARAVREAGYADLVNRSSRRPLERQ